MKRITIALLMVLVLTLLANCGFADTYYVTTDIDAVNVRSADDHDIILGIVRAGKSINVDYVKGDWAYFTFKGQPAIAYKYYLLTSLDGTGVVPPVTKTSTSGQTTSKKRAARAYVSTDDASMIYVVSDNVKKSINVRATKSQNGTILGQIYPGDEIYVVRVGKVWTRIVYDEGFAFVPSKYIQLAGVNLPDEGELYKVFVKDGTTLKVRTGPSQKKKVITTIPNGAFVKVLEDDGKWSYVYYTMKDLGYVMDKFIIPAQDFE